MDLKVTDWFKLVIGSIGSTSPFASLADISVIRWNFFKPFTHEYRSYQYLQDATLFALLSDKSAEIFKSKYLKNWNSPYWPLGQHAKIALIIYSHMHSDIIFVCK